MNEQDKIKVEMEQNLRDQLKLKEEAEKLEREYVGLEVTYSIGDKFKMGRGQRKVMIIAIPQEDNRNTVLLIILADGSFRAASKTHVKNIFEITECEFNHISHGENLVRYWDNDKKEYTGEKKA